MVKERYYVVDYIRVCVILNMIIYHTLWDIMYLFGKDIPWFISDVGNIWQKFICITFIILSGFCWSLSRNHIKRGIYILAMGFLISFVTTVFVPEGSIKYGILTMIGSSVIIMIPLEKALNKINSFAGLILSFALYIVLKDINTGYIFFHKVSLPKYLYKGELMTYMGFTEKGFYSADYFSLIPWIFMFIFGYFLYKVMKSKGWILYLKGVQNKLIEKISRGSLIIYMLHQPVVYGLLLAVFNL